LEPAAVVVVQQYIFVFKVDWLRRTLARRARF